MDKKAGFNADDLSETMQRFSEARSHSLKKADYQEIGKSLAVGSIEVVKGIFCVAAIAVISVDLSVVENTEENASVTLSRINNDYSDRP